MQRAFLYRLYPSQEQEQTLLDTLEVCRHLYNNGLAERIDFYQHDGRTVSYLDQQNQLPDLKKEASPLLEVYSQVLQDCLRRLDRAYQNFFRRVTQGTQKPGFPRFKSVGRYRSFAYPSLWPRRQDRRQSTPSFQNRRYSHSPTSSSAGNSQDCYRQ